MLKNQRKNKMINWGNFVERYNRAKNGDLTKEELILELKTLAALFGRFNLALKVEEYTENQIALAHGFLILKVFKHKGSIKEDLKKVQSEIEETENRLSLLKATEKALQGRLRNG